MELHVTPSSWEQGHLLWALNSLNEWKTWSRFLKARLWGFIGSPCLELRIRMKQSETGPQKLYLGGLANLSYSDEQAAGDGRLTSSSVQRHWPVRPLLRSISQD